MKNEHPDTYAIRVLNQVADSFASPTAVIDYNTDDGVFYQLSPRQLEYDVTVDWKKGSEHRLPALFSSLANTTGVFTLNEIWQLMKKAGASDSGCLAALPIIARESSFNGLARNPKGTAKGLFQGTDSAHPEAVASSDLWAHLPTAKKFVKSARLDKEMVSLKRFYLHVFQPAVTYMGDTAAIDQMRGWFRQSESRSTYDAQYLVNPVGAPEFTFHDCVMASVSAYKAFANLLSKPERSPLVLTLHVPTAWTVMGYKLIKGRVSEISRVSLPIGTKIERNFSQSHGEDTVAIMRDNSFTPSISNKLATMSLTPGLKDDADVEFQRTATIEPILRSEQVPEKIPSRAATLESNAGGRQHVKGFGVKIRTNFD